MEQEPVSDKARMASKSGSNIEPFTIVVPASELPRSIVDRFREPPSADARFAVTVEPAQTDAERLAALHRDLQVGLDDIAAGRASDADDVFARLKARFPAG